MQAGGPASAASRSILAESQRPEQTCGRTLEAIGAGSTHAHAWGVKDDIPCWIGLNNEKDAGSGGRPSSVCDPFNVGLYINDDRSSRIESLVQCAGELAVFIDGQSQGPH